MASTGIGWDGLRGALNKRRKGELLDLLGQAFEALPATRRARVFGDLLASPPAGKPRGRSAAKVRDEVERFHQQSLARAYFESFRVNSRNFMEKSEGTVEWIDKINRLFSACIELSVQGKHEEARASFDLLFDLLLRVDEDPDSIVFFADEAGSWQVGADYGSILPAYFASLSPSAAPAAYADRVLGLIEAFVSHDRDRFRRAARKAASKEQRKVLDKCPAVAPRAHP